ncbi:MAG: hypothetical protein RIS70_3520 [Planctomycetota bacterium]
MFGENGDSARSITGFDRINQSEVFPHALERSCLIVRTVSVFLLEVLNEYAVKFAGQLTASRFEHQSVKFEFQPVECFAGGFCRPFPLADLLEHLSGQSPHAIDLVLIGSFHGEGHRA